MFTILGGNGFIGRNIVKYLKQRGIKVWAPTRQDIKNNDLDKIPLGHVIYAIGLTADFRDNLGETVNAHAYLLERLLNNTEWQSWLYLSSTRIYSLWPDSSPANEEQPIQVSPSTDMVYNISKLLGESICAARMEKTCRVARLSNVFGEGIPEQNFLASITKDAYMNNFVEINESKNSSKDYVCVKRVVEDLIFIAQYGKHRLYNVASGINIEHSEIARLLSYKFDADIHFKPNGITRIQPQINTSRLRTEFPTANSSVFADLENFLEKRKYKQ